MQQITIGNIHSDRLTQITEVTWEEYEQLQLPKQLVSFFNGTITIMSPGRNHEIIGDLIRAVIWAYCRRIKLYPYTFNQTRLIEPGKEGKEPDVAYSFEQDKDKPDLAVEVNLTSGSINDLTKYKYLKIPEVWLWEQDKIRFFSLSLDGYLEIKTSLYLTGLTSDKPKGIASQRVSKVIKNSLSKSPLEIEQMFDSPEAN